VDNFFVIKKSLRNSETGLSIKQVDSEWQ